ncbi:signal peptidase complex catalytic subunit SEC11A isoform X1 [Suricata suricatta]|uniref:Signal peptidase complex catalytic subunit SEC11 n=1 Tax=Suricata suricatta TaxID=37032 RepID=A0A673UA50_SURSU|nr:signal peptidase complex catalytic subunit SEC11A isoform X1 [Suricata suricatta]
MLSLDFLDDVRRMNKRQLYYQVLNFGMIVSSALMIWKGLMVITGSESPIVVVLSGSMEPAFHRGDLLFLTNRVEDPIRVGEIVVFRIEGREIPIVHRVLKIHEKQNGHIKFLTKGDNNAVDDRGLYKQGQHWLEKKDVVGRARGLEVRRARSPCCAGRCESSNTKDHHRAALGGRFCHSHAVQGRAPNRGVVCSPHSLIIHSWCSISPVRWQTPLAAGNYPLSPLLCPARS